MPKTDVHFLFHEADLIGSRALRDRVQQICADRGWSFAPRGVRTFRSAGGRPVALLPPDFAVGLYERAHRSRVGVLVLGADPRVPLHPRQEDALRYNRHIQLKRYVEYKCFYCKVSSDPANDGWIGMFVRWCGDSHCDGEHDPRCLPFHVFDGQGAGLSSADARKKFNERYGSGSARLDSAGSCWRLWPAQYHGRESLCIGGHTLPVGFHWDVDTRGFRDFNTPKHAWRVSGHLNVYPDAFLRRGSGRVQQMA